MATDLLTAIIVMMIVSLACGLLAGRYVYSDRGQRTTACLAISVLATVYFLFYASGQLFWARIVPTSAAIIYTNLSALFAALAVELPYGVQDRRYAEQWGWVPGLGHSVVALGRTPGGGILISDPSVGLEAWTEADLQVLWHGAGIRVTSP